MRSLVHKSFAQVQGKGVIQLFKSYRPEYKDGEQKRDFLTSKIAWAMTAASGGGRPRRTDCSTSVRANAREWIDLSNAVFTALKKEAQHQVHRDAGGDPRQIPVFTQANLLRLRGAGYAEP